MEDKKKGKKSKKGILPAAICRILGCSILILVIGVLLPLSVPRFMGYDIYNVVSGSMEPEIPVGSVVYVEEADPVSIEPGEVIAFLSGSSVVIHRVTENRQVEGYLLTKGDANAEADLGEVRYKDLIGRVVKNIPVLGQVMTICAGTVGKVLLLCFAACGVLLNVLAGRFRH